MHTITPTAQRGTHIKIIWLLLSWYFPYFQPRMANTWLSYSLQDYPIRLSCGLGCFKIEFVLIIGFVIVNIKLVQYLQTKKSSCVGKADGSCVYYMNFDMERNVDSLEGSWLRNKIKTSMAKLPKHSFFLVRDYSVKNTTRTAIILACPLPCCVSCFPVVAMSLLLPCFIAGVRDCRPVMVRSE